MMVTPNPNTDDATLFDVPSGTIIQKPKLAQMPIASSMAPDDSKYYVANLLANSISCVSTDINVPACIDTGRPVVRKTIRLDTNYDLVIGKPTRSGRAAADPDPGEPGRQRTCWWPTRRRATIAVIDTEDGHARQVPAVRRRLPRHQLRRQGGRRLLRLRVEQVRQPDDRGRRRPQR